MSATPAKNASERPAWIPAVRYEALRRSALEEASREYRVAARRQSRARRITGLLAVVIGSGCLITALWLKEGGMVIAVCMALIAAGGVAVRTATVAPEDLSRATEEKLAAALESYRRSQLASPDFFHCEAWQALRRSMLERKDARCARCGRKASAMLVVQHIRSRAQAPELALDPANVEIVCHACRNTQMMASGTD